jgi:type II secretory pathway component PulC
MNIEHRTSNAERRTPKAWRAVLGALAVGLVLTSVAQTNSNSAASENSWPTFDSFNVIEHNNIFDPNRRPYIPGPRIHDAPRMEGFALRGTMSYSKGKFAVFDGTSGEYNKVLSEGGNIAGYTVKEITPNDVTLSANGKDFKMPVGRQVRKQQGGSWQMGRPIEPSNDETNSDDTQAATDSSAPPAAANAQMSEILKRLMEAKKQEQEQLK